MARTPSWPSTKPTSRSLPAVAATLRPTNSFVSFRIHPQETLNVDPEDPGSENAQLFFWVKLFFTCLVVAVLAFFYTHTGLWFLRSLHEKLRRKHHD